VCPACVKLNAQEGLPHKSQTKLAMVAPAEKSTRVYKLYIEGPSEWQCITCSSQFKVNVGVTAIPLHRCKKRSNKSFPMEQIIQIKTKKFKE